MAWLSLAQSETTVHVYTMQSYNEVNICPQCTARDVPVRKCELKHFMQCLCKLVLNFLALENVSRKCLVKVSDYILPSDFKRSYSKVVSHTLHENEANKVQI